MRRNRSHNRSPIMAPGRKHCFGAKQNYLYTSSCITPNHLIIIGKYFLYINGVHDEKRPQFTDFVTLVNEKVEFEKFIAITTKKPLSFDKK